jgi:hypothetical protein
MRFEMNSVRDSLNKIAMDFQLKRTLTNLTQGNDLVSVYYGKLKTIWDELTLHYSMQECSYGYMKVLTD